MKHYFTKYICNKDFVEDFWKTENENKMKQMMEICHNTCQISQDIESVIWQSFIYDSIEMWNTDTLNKQTKLYLLFKVKKTKISICPLWNIQFFTEIAFQ